MTTTVEAGRKGGLVVLHKHGREFYSRIGRLGQAVTHQRYSGMAAEWGRKGGMPRKSIQVKNVGEEDHQ
jgi:general stress protein YciG